MPNKLPDLIVPEVNSIEYSGIEEEGYLAQIEDFSTESCWILFNIENARMQKTNGQLYVQAVDKTSPAIVKIINAGSEKENILIIYYPHKGWKTVSDEESTKILHYFLGLVIDWK